MMSNQIEPTWDIRPSYIRFSFELPMDREGGYGFAEISRDANFDYEAIYEEADGTVVDRRFFANLPEAMAWAELMVRAN